MTSTKTNTRATEFGDFQTPPTLAQQVCQILTKRGITPASLIEPTCGSGNFLLAALDQYATARTAVGVEINEVYVNELLTTLQNRSYTKKVWLVQDNIFHVDLPALLRDLPEPILAIGNPPWVTNAQLGILGSQNLPRKTNFQKHSGMDAITGKSNFDVSEWMLLRLMELLSGREATMAMLCKTTVARKVLAYAGKHQINLQEAEIRRIDAAKFFGAAVDACLFVCSFAPAPCNTDCLVFHLLEDKTPAQTIGYRDGQLIADLSAYDHYKHLQGKEAYKWRSGIKHDCAKVMELQKEGARYRNGFGELVELEEDFLYPLLKGSEIANNHAKEIHRRMLVTQTTVGNDTNFISLVAPKTWSYLQEHGMALDRRASVIYRNRPRFSIFGVGNYSFSPWKVTISSLYKKLCFRPVGSVAGKPVVLDDTSYFIPCESESESYYLASLLNSSAAREFLSAFIFWDAKRPITIDILKRLDLIALARELGTEGYMNSLLAPRKARETNGQLPLFSLHK